jgi:hypothetical protein
VVLKSVVGRAPKSPDGGMSVPLRRIPDPVAPTASWCGRNVAGVYCAYSACMLDAHLAACTCDPAACCEPAVEGATGVIDM